MANYQPRDKFSRRAQAEGLKSRAAFKLIELLERYRITFPGARVIDLGCAPGGWLVILTRAVGQRGRVVGIDLAKCINPPAGASTIVADIRDSAVPAMALERLGGKADAVTSDLSPKLTGIRDRDQARAVELLESALRFARQTLKPRGSMIAKIFMSTNLAETVKTLETSFERVEIARTKATRLGSAELYLVGLNFKHGVQNQTPPQ
jgi:23S rRNA (uridine2552-2'-O)-methyltransferase